MLLPPARGSSARAENVGAPAFPRVRPSTDRSDLQDQAMLLSGMGYSCGDPNCPLTAEQFTRADYDGDCSIGLGDLAWLLSSFGQTSTQSNYVGYTWDAEN